MVTKHIGFWFGNAKIMQWVLWALKRRIQHKTSERILDVFLLDREKNLSIVDRLELAEEPKYSRDQIQAKTTLNPLQGSKTTEVFNLHFHQKPIFDFWNAISIKIRKWKWFYLHNFWFWWIFYELCGSMMVWIKLTAQYNQSLHHFALKSNKHACCIYGAPAIDLWAKLKFIEMCFRQLL